VNGELTLGENIADNSGLAIAYKAYQISLKGKKAPVIDGLTGDQRLYMGWAQVWRTKMREQQQIVQVKTDPHSPGQFRANGTLRNQPGFYDAFKVKQGDKMYLAPQDAKTKRPLMSAASFFLAQRRRAAPRKRFTAGPRSSTNRL
jgi:predicted metalloendopeptidase